MLNFLLVNYLYEIPKNIYKYKYIYIYIYIYKMSACEASMSLLFYFSRGKQYLDVFLLFSKMSYKGKKDKISGVQCQILKGTSCLARQCISCEII